MEKDLSQAYKQAPWRIQIQRLGFILIGVIVLAGIAGFYVLISGQTAEKGYTVQTLQSKVEQLKRQNNDLQTQLGEIKSVQALSQRLSALDMQPLDPDDTLYLEIPGYIPADTLKQLAPPVTIRDETGLVLLPEFTSSFVEWLTQKLQGTASNEVQP
jgi:Tfp pilus assembly protein PilN